MMQEVERVFHNSEALIQLWRIGADAYPPAHEPSRGAVSRCDSVMFLPPILTYNTAWNPPV